MKISSFGINNNNINFDGKISKAVFFKTAIESKTISEIASKCNRTETWVYHNLKRYGLSLPKENLIEQFKSFAIRACSLQEIADYFQESILWVDLMLEKCKMRDLVKENYETGFLKKIYELMKQGYSKKEIAKELNISVLNIEFLVRKYNKLPYKQVESLNRSTSGKLLSPEELKRVAESATSANEIANYFGIAKCTVYKLLKKYSIPYNFRKNKHLQMNRELLEEAYDLIRQGLNKKEVCEKLNIEEKKLLMLIRMDKNKTFVQLKSEIEEQHTTITQEALNEIAKTATSIKKIAAHFGVSVYKISVLLKRYSISLNYGQGKFAKNNKEVLEEIYKMLAEGLSLHEISQKLAIPQNALKKLMENDKNIPLRDILGDYQIIYRDKHIDREEFITFLESSKSVQEVATHFGMSERAVYVIMQKLSVKNRFRENKRTTTLSKIYELMKLNYSPKQIATKLNISFYMLKTMVERDKNKPYEEVQKEIIENL